MNESTILLIAGWMFVGSAPFLFFCGWFQIRKRNRRFGEARFAEGTLIDSPVGQEAPGALHSLSRLDSRRPGIHRKRFVFTEGKREYSGTSEVSSNQRNFSSGDKVTVIYNPKDPSKCEIYDRQYKLFNAIPFLIGSGFLVIGGFLVFVANNTGF